MLERVKVRGVVARAWANNTHANYIKEATSLKTQLRLVEKRIETLGDQVGRVALEVTSLRSKLSLSVAKIYVTKGKHQ